MLQYVDFLIVISFLLTTLVIGLYTGRGVSNIKDYALGGNNFTTISLISTIVATYTTGSLFVVGLSKIYTNGLLYFLPLCCFPFSLIISAYIFIPRMSRFIGHVSVAESMGRFYGTTVRAITAASAICAILGIISVQYKVFAGVVSYFSGIDTNSTIICSGVVVTLYSAFGGIKAVTFTDIIQFMIFGAVLPFIGFIVWDSTFHIENFSFQPALNSPAFSIDSIFKCNSFETISIILLSTYALIPAIHPAYFQRIIMGRTVEQAKNAFIISALILLLVIIAIGWISFLIFSINPNLQPNEIISFIIDKYTYTGFKGMVIAGVMAMSMSSSDSFINVASVLFVNDVCKPLLKIKFNEMVVVRIFAIIIGFFSIFLALWEKDLLKMVLFANAFYIPLIAAPLMLTILGLRTTSNTILAGMSISFVCIIIWKTYLPRFDPIVPIMFLNMMMIIIYNYIFKQGYWINTKPKEITIKYKTFKEKVRGFSIMNFLLRNAAHNEQTYSFFGVFCFISTISTIYLTHDRSLSLQYSYVIKNIYLSMLFISSFFLLYLMWSPRVKNPIIVSIVWNIALVYMLSFCSTFFVLMSQFGHMQIIVFTLNLMVLFNLCKWRTAISILTMGIVLGSWFYLCYANKHAIQMINKEGYISIIYVGLLTATAFITFMKPRQEYIEQTEGKLEYREEQIDHLSKESANLTVERVVLKDKLSNLNSKVGHYEERVIDQAKEIERLGATSQKILNNLNHELRLPVGNVMNFADMLNDGLEKFSPDQLKLLSSEVYKNTNRLSSMILNMLDLAMLNAKNVELNKRTINLRELIEYRVQQCSKTYLENKNIKFDISEMDQDIIISLDPNYMRQVIDNIIINAIKFSKKGIISISLKVHLNEVIIVIKDQGLGVSEIDKHNIFEPFKMGECTESKAEGRGVGLALCKAAIKAHKGTIEVGNNNEYGKGAVFTITLPV